MDWNEFVFLVIIIMMMMMVMAVMMIVRRIIIGIGQLLRQAENSECCTTPNMFYCYLPVCCYSIRFIVFFGFWLVGFVSFATMWLCYAVYFFFFRITTIQGSKCMCFATSISHQFFCFLFFLSVALHVYALVYRRFACSWLF